MIGALVFSEHDRQSSHNACDIVMYRDTLYSIHSLCDAFSLLCRQIMYYFEDRSEHTRDGNGKLRNVPRFLKFGINFET